MKKFNKKSIIQIVNTQNSNLTKNTYHVLNKDVELCGKYFDVVPDGNLYTIDNSPIFAIRMRAMGIRHIMDMYQQKYGFNTDVLEYKIHAYQYMLYSSDVAQMYNTQKETLIKYFDFSTCKDGEFRGVIIVATNEDDRMIHAIPYIYGVVNGRKKLIFLDSFFALNIDSGCIIGADFFYRAYNGDIDCYCHGETVQADHHSCGIIACDFIKNCLQNNNKVVKKILKSVKMRAEIDNNVTEKKTYVNVYSLPSELLRFSQTKHNKAFEISITDVSNEQEKQEKYKWFANHTRTLIYHKDPDPYNPIGEVMPSVDGEKKLINTSLLEKGHKYAGQIVKDLKQNTVYNSNYWLSIIREQKEDNVIRSFIKRARRILKYL